MANLKDDEIRRIVNRATMFQKFYGASFQQSVNKLEEQYPHLFEITDSLNLQRSFVIEALLEHQGIPVEEPMVLEAGFNNAEVVGFSSGDLNPETLKELRAHIEYHFNTVGELKHRNNKTSWKAMPKGLARFISSQNSPEVGFELSGNALKISAKQSMKTVNKFYLPSLGGLFGGFMMFAGTVMGKMGSDEVAGMIGFMVILGITFLYTRVIYKQKKKRKSHLGDLVEQLQQILKRRQKVGGLHSDKISIPDNEYDGVDEIEIKDTKKVSTD